MTTIPYILLFILSVIHRSVCQDLSLVNFEQLVSYTKCRVDEDCIKISNNSFCFDNDADKIGFCKCRDTYEMVSRNRTFFACLGPAGYGEPCEKNMQCQLTLTENAECSNSVCRCKDGAHRFTDGRCYVSVLLGDFCRSDGNCWMTGDTFGNCIFGRCTCKYIREVPNEDKLSCVVGKSLGEICNSDSECALVPNTQCRVNCRCAPDFVLSRNLTMCLRVGTQFSDPCEENEQCSAFLPGSICSPFHNCSCPEGFHGFNNKCVRSASIGGSCTSIEECIPDMKFSDSVNCVGGTCTCLNGVVNEMLGCSKGSFIEVNLFVLFGFVIFYPMYFYLN